MATTTNYGWDTPDDTDLVKDGAAAIRTLGSSIDTTTKALNPSTTLGDIEYRSSTADTNTRLALGTAGQVLTVNSGATAPEWATSSSGGMTLLSTTTLSGNTTTISSIDQTYTDLQIIIFGYTNASANGQPALRPNGSNTITDFILTSNNNFSYSSIGGIDDQFLFGGSNGDRTNANNVGYCLIKNYSNTTSYKAFQASGGFKLTTTYGSYIGGGSIKTTSAITSIVIKSDGAGTFSAGTCLIYGVK